MDDNTMYLIHILRHGDAKLGRGLFGIYTSLDRAFRDVCEYNQYSGGKYPAFDFLEMPINEGEFNDIPIRVIVDMGWEN